MSKIDISKLKGVDLSKEEDAEVISTKDSTESALISMASKELSIPEPEAANGFSAAKAPGAGGNIAGIFIPSLIKGAVDLINTGLQVYATVQAERENTKRYKAQAKAYVRAQKEITNRMANVETTKQLTIRANTNIKMEELRNEMKALKYKYKDSSAQRKLERKQWREVYNEVHKVIKHHLDICQQLQEDDRKAGYSNPEIKARLDDYENKLNAFMLQLLPLLSQKGV